MDELHSSSDRIIARARDHENFTEEFFRRFVREIGLQYLLHGCDGWAIVGGAVRDMLLLGKNPSRAWPFPDLDVIIAPSTQAPLKTMLDELGIKTAYNSFGNFAVIDPQYGVMDVIPARAPSVAPSATLRASMVSAELAQFNFGLNAAAFHWPSERLFVHPRWWSDLRTRQIEVLAEQHNELPHLRPACAAALAVKLEERGIGEMSFGPLLKAEVAALRGNSALLVETRAYIARKIASGRWNQAVSVRFEALLASS